MVKDDGSNGRLMHGRHRKNEPVEVQISRLGKNLESIFGKIVENNGEGCQIKISIDFIERN